jgi:hypothetical protein
MGKKVQKLVLFVKLVGTHGEGLEEHSKNVFSFADDILNPF